MDMERFQVEIGGAMVEQILKLVGWFLYIFLDSQSDIMNYVWADQLHNLEVTYLFN